MEEKREHRRHKLDPQLSLINPETGEDAGLVVDITPHGMQIVTDKSLQVGKTEILTILLNEQIFGKKTIEIEARAVWKKSPGDTRKSSYGLDFVSVDPQDEGIIIALIYEQGSDRTGEPPCI